MNGSIAIYGRDHASFDRNDMIILWSSDHPRVVRMRPRRVDGEVLHWIRPLDFNPTIVIILRIHRPRSILAVIIGEIDG